MIGSLALLVVGGTAGFTAPGQDAGDSLTVTAVFTDAGPILPGNDVKVQGVTAGKIEKVSLVDGAAHVRLEMQPEFLPLHEDARATVRPVSLLGERFIDLQVGSPASPLLEDGDRIPATQTAVNTDLDQVLDVIDKPTGEALATVLTTLGLGVQGRGSEADAALRTLPGALGETDELVAVLEKQNATINELIDATTPVAASLDTERGQALDRLVGSARTLLGSTAAEAQALDTSLQRLPGTLAAAQRTLGALTGTADATTPLLRDIRPVTQDLTEISRELSALSAAADPALSGLQPVLDEARRLVKEAKPVVTDLRAATPAIASVAKDGVQVADALIGNDEKLADLLDFIRFWAMATQEEDGLSHYFRAHVIASEETLQGPLPVDTPAKNVTKDPPGLPGAAPVTPTAPRVPGIPGVPGLPLPEITSPLDLVGAVGKESATGLTITQEKDLLGFLIGGGA